MAKSFLRIRPIDGFSSKDPSSAFFKIDDMKIECRPPQHSQSFKNSKSNLRESKRKVFEFDKVLDGDANQEQLYNDCVQPLLTEYFNGENVLLFAYGTTSSGEHQMVYTLPFCCFSSDYNIQLRSQKFNNSKFIMFLKNEL